MCVGMVALITIVVVVTLGYQRIRYRKSKEYNPSVCALNPCQSVSLDKWEFPRERLHIFQNRMLGNAINELWYSSNDVMHCIV